MSGNGLTVALDLNGLLVDVRRREAPSVVGRAPDAVLPNGQKAYLHPRREAFLAALAGLPGVSIVLYTSRLRRNAEPIEQLLARDIEGVLRIERSLYGEQCAPPGPAERFHPRKIARFVRPDTRNVVFVDDHPSRIIADGARVVAARSYDAARAAETEPYLGRALRDLLQVVLREK